MNSAPGSGRYTMEAAQNGGSQAEAGDPGGSGGAGNGKGARVAVLEATRADAVGLVESERSLGKHY